MSRRKTPLDDRPARASLHQIPFRAFRRQALVARYTICVRSQTSALRSAAPCLARRQSIDPSTAYLSLDSRRVTPFLIGSSSCATARRRTTPRTGCRGSATFRSTRAGAIRRARSGGRCAPASGPRSTGSRRPARFFASPLERARETMELVRAAMDLPPEPYRLDEALMEITFGEWEGLTWPEVRARDPEGVTARRADKWGFVPPGGESYAMLVERLRPWLASLGGRRLRRLARRRRARVHDDSRWRSGPGRRRDPDRAGPRARHSRTAATGGSIERGRRARARAAGIGRDDFSARRLLRPDRRQYLLRAAARSVRSPLRSASRPRRPGSS